MTKVILALSRLGRRRRIVSTASFLAVTVIALRMSISVATVLERPETPNKLVDKYSLNSNTNGMSLNCVLADFLLLSLCFFSRVSEFGVRGSGLTSWVFRLQSYDCVVLFRICGFQ